MHLSLSVHYDLSHFISTKAQCSLITIIDNKPVSDYRKANYQFIYSLFAKNITSENRVVYDSHACFDNNQISTIKPIY